LHGVVEVQEVELFDLVRINYVGVDILSNLVLAVVDGGADENPVVVFRGWVVGEVAEIKREILIGIQR